LITLGIIGVVSAITVPTIISKIQDRQNIAKWKREYSLIANAFQSVLNNGIQICGAYNKYGTCTDPIQSTVTRWSDDFVAAMMQKFTVVDYCGLSTAKDCNYYNINVWEKNSTTKWSGVANVYSRYKALGSTINNDSGNQHGIMPCNFYEYAYLLNDGAVVYFGGSYEGPWIVVDVNNFTKGPNEFGRDVFLIKVSSNTKTNQHWIKPAGAEGTPNWDNPDSGSSGCSKDIGKQTIISDIYNVAGAGCSAKYLLE